MPISFRRTVRSNLFAPALLLCILSFTASQAIAQEATPQTPLEKQLSRIDFAILGAANMGTTVSGVEQRDAATTHTVLTIKPSRTVGEMATLRYTAKPWVGFEFNFGNARWVQDYTFVPPPTANLLLGGAQTSVREMTFGYVAHPPHQFFGIQPYLGLGGGTIHFKPTTFGGQGLPDQYRAVYYYEVGGEANFPDSHFGMRAGFKQDIYLAPDFLQNYLTITRRVRTSQPEIGFFVRF